MNGGVGIRMSWVEKNIEKLISGGRRGRLLGTRE